MLNDKLSLFATQHKCHVRHLSSSLLCQPLVIWPTETNGKARKLAECLHGGGKDRSHSYPLCMPGYEAFL